MNVIKNLLNSEKAVALGVLVIAATVLTALGHMAVSEWKEYTMVLAGIYVAGKTIQGGVDSLASAKVEAAQVTASQDDSAIAGATDLLKMLAAALKTPAEGVDEAVKPPTETPADTPS